MLVADENGQLYRARRIPGIPSEEMRIIQTSWHEGFGNYLQRGNEQSYAFSDGVDLRHANGAQLVNQFAAGSTGTGSSLDYLLRNGNGENNSTSGWTATNTTHTTPTTAARTGNRHLRLTETSSHATGVNYIEQALSNPTVYQSREITVIGYLKRVSGTGSIRIAIRDDAGNTTSSDVTASSYTYASVARTLDGSTAAVTIDIEAGGTAGGGSDVYDVDDLAIVPTGGTIPYSMRQFSDVLYLAAGRVISTWDNSNSVFEAVLIDATEEFTSLEIHGGFIYGAHGSGYSHSNDTSDPRITWTDVTPSAGAANFFISALDHTGTQRLYRGDKPNEMYVSNEAFGDGSGIIDSEWGSAVVVGETDTDITNMYNAFDSVIVGKEDGLYYFYPPDNKFRPATTSMKLLPDAENFDHGVEYLDGFLYLTMARLGMQRMTFSGGDPLFQAVAPRYLAPMFDDYGGRVRALVHDGMFLYALQDRPVADTSTTKTINVLAASNEVTENGLNIVWHTLKTLTMGDIRIMFVEADRLYLMGRLFDSNLSDYTLAPIRMDIPAQHRNPFKDTGPLMDTAGSFVTPIFDFADFGYGDDDKAFIKVCIIADGLTSGRTITIEEQIDADIDDSGSWTAVGSAITSGPTATVSFTSGSGSTGRRCRLRITFASDASTTGPVLRQLCIYAVPSPDRYREWEFLARLDTGQMLLNGAADDRTSETILANLNTLEAEDFPIKLFTPVQAAAFDADIVEMEVILKEVGGTDGRLETEHLEQLVRLRIREVLTS